MCVAVQCEVNERESVTGCAQCQTVRGLELHRATPSDRVALIAMFLSFEPKGAALGLPPRKDIESWLDRLSVYPNFLALVEGRVVGHAVLCLEADSGEVAVFVHQDYRGLGLGVKLLSELLDEARRRGLRHVWGVTDPDNVPMLRLARFLGFLPGKERGEFCLRLESGDSSPVALAPAA